MGISLIIAAAALLALGVLLSWSLGIVQGLGEKFALLDRDGQLPRLRLLVMASCAMALLAAAAVLVLALVPPKGRAPAEPDPVAATKPSPAKAAAAPSRAAPPAEPAPKPVVAPAAAPPATAAPAPAPAASPAPATSAPAKTKTFPPSSSKDGDWRLARIVSSGEVTFRAWPNGTALSQLDPGEPVQIRGEVREAGGHTWERVRLADGRLGWVVQRFVRPD